MIRHSYFDAHHTPNRKANMAEEEEKKGDDKGDHINLKVKDQVRRQAVVTRHDPAARSDARLFFLFKPPCQGVSYPDRPTRPDPPQDNSEVHFKVRHTTKFEKVRAFIPRRARADPSPAWRVRLGNPRSPRPHLPLTSSPRLPPQIFNAFCSRKSLQPGAVRFLFDGQRINPHQTPKEVRVPSPPPRLVVQILPRAGNRNPCTGCQLSDPPSFAHASPPSLSSPTPQLDMEDGDSIDAMMEQVGGR